MDDRVGFCKRDDGVTLAYVERGEGFPLVTAPGWVSHIEHHQADPDVGAYRAKLAAGRRIITYDKHGTGLSDRDRADFSLDAEVRDLATIVDRLGLETFDLMGLSEGGPVAIRYAATHPERIRRLVLYATFAVGPSLASREFRESFVGIVRASWGIGSKTMTDMLVPGVDPAKAAEFARWNRRTTTAEIAAGILESMYSWDVSEDLPRISAPTLVIQRRGDRAFRPQHARMLAAGIPDSRLVLQEGDQHAPWYGDTDALVAEVHAFLDEERDSTQQPAASAPGNIRLLLFTDVVASTDLTDHFGDMKAREILREHEQLTRAALSAHGGTEVKTMGDGFMASFTSASAALDAAIEMQRAIERRFGDTATPVHIRVGINAGEPIEEDRDLYGTAVIRAARIMSQAGGMEILVSDVVRQLVAGKDYAFADRGAHALKGFEEPVRLFELHWRRDD
ncbi:MAG: adenylate/guanylate cyclase domain-containing protein [Dehalococcoidia bacterium]